MLTAVALSALFVAQLAAPNEAQAPIERAPAVSSELLDPDGLSRFHLVTRAMFSDGDSVFSSGSSAWSSELRAHLSLAEGFALSAVLPIGVQKRRGLTTQGFVGNIPVGATLGGRIDLGPRALGEVRKELRFGGGVDVYLPIAPNASDSPELLAAESMIAAMRSYEPQLYISQLFSFRARGYVDVVFGGLQAALELGLVPGWTTRAPSSNVILFSGAGRLSYELLPEVEPFIEAGCAKQIAGDGDVAPPFLLTLGSRFHLGEVLDPAVFVSFNFVSSSAVIFGIDIARAIRSSRLPGPRNENREDFDEFLPPS